MNEDMEVTSPNSGEFILEQLQRFGSDVNRKHEVSFWLYFPSEDLAQQAARRAESTGLKTESVGFAHSLHPSSMESSMAGRQVLNLRKDKIQHCLRAYGFNAAPLKAAVQRCLTAGFPRSHDKTAYLAWPCLLSVFQYPLGSIGPSGSEDAPIRVIRGKKTFADVFLFFIAVPSNQETNTG